MTPLRTKEAILELSPPTDLTDLNNHMNDVNNPHNVSKSQIGLGNVDNTSDLDKPISTATQSAIEDKVDKVTGKGLSENDYTNTDKNKVGNIDQIYTSTEKTKLDGIEEGAQVNHTGQQIKTLYEGNDNTNAFTDDEKDKLATLESSKFRGQYESLGALEIAEPSPPIGSYAYVDEGEGVDVVKYLWDSSDEAWTLSGNVSQELTPSQVKDLYEDNPDTNAFTDTEKTKLTGIEVGAQVNVKSDWDATTGDVEILNKPTIDGLLGGLASLGFVKRNGANSYTIDTSTYQPLDADLTAIAAISGTSGLLRKTASNTWQLDTSVYLTAITKAQVEAVLIGTITTHTHNASAIAEDASHRFVTDTQISTWNNKVDKITGKGLSTEDYTTIEKTKLTGIEEGAQVNTVTSVAGKTGCGDTCCE